MQHLCNISCPFGSRRAERMSLMHCGNIETRRACGTLVYVHWMESIRLVQGIRNVWTASVLCFLGKMSWKQEEEKKTVIWSSSKYRARSATTTWVGTLLEILLFHGRCSNRNRAASRSLTLTSSLVDSDRHHCLRDWFSTISLMYFFMTSMHILWLLSPKRSSLSSS